jgi:hypothetical protein
VGDGRVEVGGAEALQRGELARHDLFDLQSAGRKSLGHVVSFRRF